MTLYFVDGLGASPADRTIFVGRELRRNLGCKPVAKVVKPPIA